MTKDPREQEKSPKSAEEQEAPAPERPVPPEEKRRSTGQPEKPSQAEGSREAVEE